MPVPKSVEKDSCEISSKVKKCKFVYRLQAIRENNVYVAYL